MKKNCLYIVFAILFFTGLQFNSALADDKIHIKLLQPPPNKLSMKDLWKLDITNTTNGNINIYLTGTATASKKGLVVSGKSKVLTVAPGKKTYTYEDFKSGEVNWKDKSIQEVLMRTGNVPEDDYTICVTAFYEGGEIADQESCIEQSIKLEGDITLVSPDNNAKIDPDTLPGLTFSWTPLPDAKDYTLRIVEIKGTQSKEAAMKENRSFFEKIRINTTTFQYPLSEKKFEKGKKYVWMVMTGSVKSETFSFGIGGSIEPLTPLMFAYVNGSKNSSTIDACTMQFSFNHQYGGTSGDYHLKVIDITSNPTACGYGPCDLTPVLDYITISHSLIVEFNNTTGLSIDVNTGAPITPTPNGTLISGHQYLLISCEGSMGAWGVASNCVSFLYNGCIPPDPCQRHDVSMATIAEELYSVSNCPALEPDCVSYDQLVTLENHYIWFGPFNHLFSISEQNSMVADARQWALDNRPLCSNGTLQSIVGITYLTDVIVGSNENNNVVGISVQYGCCTTVLPQCACKGWKPVIATYNGIHQSFACGSTINLPANTGFTISTDLICSGKDCDKLVEAKLIPPNGNSIPVYTGNGPAVISGTTSSSSGDFDVFFSGTCNDFTSCVPCNIHVRVDSSIVPSCDSAVACFTMKDTVCLTDCFVIDSTCCINETDYFISVQESDINWNRYGMEYMEWFTGAAPNSIDIKEWFTTKGGEWKCDKYFRVKIAVKNSCTPWSEFTKLLYVECCNNDTCADFENGTPQGWIGNNSDLTTVSNGGNPGQYIQTTDLPNASYISNSSSYTGKWIDSLCNNSCVSLCFDVNFIFPGEVYNGQTPPTTMTPSITIIGSNGCIATFVITTGQITVGSGWHSYCAPIIPINPGDPLPSNSNGHWVMNNCPASNWNSLINDVAQVRLPVDPSNFQKERIGYDNICLKNSSAIANFTAKDTVCINEPFVINGSGCQNESGYFIGIVESDVNWGIFGNGQQEWFTGTAPSSIDIKGWYAAKGGEWKCGTYYWVKIAVTNSCTPWNSFSKLIYVECCDNPCDSVVKCSDFESGTSPGWQVSLALMGVKPVGGNPGKYLESTDQQHGPSILFNDTTYNGNWLNSLCDSCGSICFDVNYIYEGDAFNNQIPPTTMTPSITISNGSLTATFVASSTITKGDGWHRYCAPFKYLNPGEPLPFNSSGHWVTTCTNAQWNALLSNVTRVRLPVDLHSFQKERMGYDNICIKNTCN